MFVICPFFIFPSEAWIGQAIVALYSATVDDTRRSQWENEPMYCGCIHVHKSMNA